MSLFDEYELEPGHVAMSRTVARGIMLVMRVRGVLRLTDDEIEAELDRATEADGLIHYRSEP